MIIKKMKVLVVLKMIKTSFYVTPVSMEMHWL